MVCVESLAVKNLLQNEHLAKAIADVGWSEILRQLAYKASAEAFADAVVFQLIGNYAQQPQAAVVAALAEQIARLAWGGHDAFQEGAGTARRWHGSVLALACAGAGACSWSGRCGGD